MSAFRQKLQARFVEAGFWSQLVLLGLVDWASISAMQSQGGTVGLWAGLLALNAVLLLVAFVMLRWMRRQGRGAHG